MSLAGSNRKPALTAAARRIAFSRQTADKLKEESWQERAWAVYGNLPEVFYMTRYRSDVASKVEYFVATQDEPGSDPDFDEAGAGTKVLEAEGGPGLLRRIVSEMIVHWDIPGEAYLTRFDEAPLWRVLSTQELKKHGTRFAWGDEENDLGSIEKDQVFRVWDPHPRFHWQADSPTRHVLDNAEELILLTREAKASSMSRVSAGLFVLPDSIDLSPFADDEDGTPDDVARWLVDVLAKPISDPGSSSSVVPAVMTMHGDDIAKIRHITFARDWEINLELRRELLRSVAAGLDLPPEILTGMADLNHWTAWQVSEQAVSQHVLPSVDAILDSLTINWFRPLLEASGVNPEGYVLWRDPSPATVSPDQSDVAIRMYEQDAISGEALRRVTNFDEEDAPTPEELEDKTARRSASTQGVPSDGPPVQSAIDPDDALRFFELLDRNPRLADLLQQAFVKEGDPPLARAAVTAATRRRIVATELAEIDAEILVWVQDQADLEIERLTKLALSAAVDPLDESLLTGLASELDVKIAKAQEAARSWLSRTLGRTPSDDGESLARNQGVQVIIGGILEAVRRKLFTPGGGPDPIELGQIGNISTPTQAIRHGLSLAGGGPAVYEDGKAAELIGNGQHVHDELAEDGFFQDGYEWKYGHPANTFEPHLHLDGKQFTSWDDPQLAVNFGDSWLRRSYYAPGDHKGCCCAFIQVIVEAFKPIEGRDTSGDGTGLGFGSSPLTAEAGLLPGKSYGYTVDPNTGKLSKRTTLKRKIDLDLVPERHRADVERMINETLDAHSPAFRTPTLRFGNERSQLANVAEYDSFGLVGGGKDSITFNANAMFDADGNWRENRLESFREVLIHENAHRTSNLANFAAPEEMARFGTLADSEMRALTSELTDTLYIQAEHSQMIYPISILRREVGGNLVNETFSEMSAFAFDSNLGTRYAPLRDAILEVIDASSQWLNSG